MEITANYLLHASLVLSVYAFLISALGGIKRNLSFVSSARNAVWAYTAAVSVCVGILLFCLVQGRFQLEYVHQYTNSTMPTFYKFAALWGGQNGSLLFWLLILCLYSSAVLFQHRRKNLELMPYVISTLAFIASFFLTILVFKANPFTTVPFTVTDGKGLNPLLQNYYMIIHPPSLYLGYVGMSVPFAFAIAALASRRLDNTWIVQTRLWTLIAWFFLSIGNLLGASWAYEVLGWGGYWGWDPVENAAFIPWLTATAFLHSAIIQEKRNMLKTWNMVLVILSFLMTMTGTFLTRSGIVSSVHAFAQSDIGPFFITFLVLAISVSVGLLVLRLNDLRSKSMLDSLLSRESAFLLNNLILVGMAFAILWGTLFPVLSEAVRGTKITVGPPYFNSIMVPIGLILLLLTGVGPLVGWRKTTAAQLKQHFVIPSVASILTSVLCLFFIKKHTSMLVAMYVNVSFALSAFVMTSIIMEYREGMRMRRRVFGEDVSSALIRLVASNRRRYGGYIVHAGVVLMFIGFTGNAFRQEIETQLVPEQSTRLGAYQIQYVDLITASDPHKDVMGAKLYVWRNGKSYATLRPSKVIYKSSTPGQEGQPDTHVAIKRRLSEDFYTAFLSYNPADKSVFLKLIVNPLVQFIWIGGLLLIVGSVITMLPSRTPRARVVV